MRRHVGQREAHAAVKRVAELEQQRRDERCAWSRQYPGGVHLGTITMSNRDWLLGRLEGAQMAGSVLVAKVNGAGREIEVYAVR